MLRTEFDHELKQTAAEFDGKEFPAPGLASLWEFCRSITAAELRRAIEQVVLAAPTRKPTLAAIRAAVLPAIQGRRDRARAEQIAQVGDDCDYCGGTGQMEARKLDDPPGVLYSYRCTFCSAQETRRLAQTIRPWPINGQGGWTAVPIRPAQARREALGLSYDPNLKHAGTEHAVQQPAGEEIPIDEL